jgi:type IV pilus assembly protein PilX
MKKLTRSRSVPRRRQQRGVVLFVALIAMVLLSLAGVALVRSVDTSNSIAGNIAFRQGSIGPINTAIEMAIDGIFKSKSIALLNQNNISQGYYALLQPGEQPNGIPDVLAGDYATMSAKYSAAGLPAPVTDLTTKMEVRSVIERVCTDVGPGPWAVHPYTCDTLPPKLSGAGTDNTGGVSLSNLVAQIPNYRVTVRVDMPNSNTVSHAQAFVR